MSDKALMIVAGYLVFAFAVGVFLGKAIKRANPCQHQWEARGYGGAGWTLLRCKLCGDTEIDSA